MRKLLTIAAILISFLTSAQTIQFLGSPTTQIYVRGQIRIDTVMYLPIRDTNFVPAQKGALISRASDNGLYLFDGTQWNKVAVGSTAWGTITGLLSNQADLVDTLTHFQRTISAGYGIKKAGNALLFDSAVARKVDSVFRLNDSTIRYAINGTTYDILIRGTAAGGITSLSLAAPSSVFNTPVTFINTGGVWTGTLSLVNQNPSSFFAGPASGSPDIPAFRALSITDLPTGIPNSYLQNSLLNVATGTTGTDINWASTPISLGGTATINIPTASASNRGVITPFFFNQFTNKVDSTSKSNDTVYDWHNGGSTFRYQLHAGIDSISGQVKDSFNITRVGRGSLTSPYAFIADNASSYYRRNNIRNLQNKWYNMIKNGAYINCGFFGNSETDFNWIIDRNFKEIMNLKTPMAGPGYMAASQTVNYAVSAVPALDAGSHWTANTLSTGGLGLSAYSATSTSTPGQWGYATVDATKTFSKFTNFDVFYLGTPSGGRFSVKIDGVIRDTVDTSVGTGVVKHSYTGLSDSVHAIIYTSLTTNATILGANAFRASGGFVFHRIGQIGAKTSDYLALDSTLWSNQVKLLGPNGPDISFIFLGTNDKANANILPDTFKVHMHKIIVRLKAANPLMDIVVVGPSENDTAFWHSYPISAYNWNQTLRQLCDDDTVAFFDIDKFQGPYAKANARGDFRDGIHYDTLFAYGIVSQMINQLPITNTANLSQLFQAAYGFNTPQNSIISGTQGQALILGSTNNITATPLMSINASNRLLYNTTDITSNTVQIGGTLSTTGAVRINGASGTLGINASGGARIDNAMYVGSTANKPANVIGIDGDGSSFNVEMTNQSSLDGVVIKNFAAVPRDMSTNGVALLKITQDIGALNTTNNIYYGIVHRPNFNNVSANTNTAFRSYGFLPFYFNKGNAVYEAFYNSNSDLHFGDSSGREWHGPATLATIFNSHPGITFNKSISINKDSVLVVSNSPALYVYVTDTTKNFATSKTLDRLLLSSITSGFTNPMTTIGDIIYGGASGAATRLAGNTTTARQFYTSTGTGSAAQAPTIGGLVSGDIPNNAANTSGTAANLSGTPALPNGITATTQSASDNSTKLATTAYADRIGSSGTYTPTLTNSANLTTSSLGEASYMIVGSRVHVCISGSMTPTTATTLTTLTFTLPFTSSRTSGVAGLGNELPNGTLSGLAGVCSVASSTTGRFDFVTGINVGTSSPFSLMFDYPL